MHLSLRGTSIPLEIGVPNIYFSAKIKRKNKNKTFQTYYIHRDKRIYNTKKVLANCAFVFSSYFIPLMKYVGASLQMLFEQKILQWSTRVN